MEAHKIIAALRANGNELKELISLSSFIDKVENQYPVESFTGDDFIDVINYNRLLKIELRIGLFVTSINGEPVEKKGTYLRAFKDAKKEVIFKGWEFSKKENGCYVLLNNKINVELRFDTDSFGQLDSMFLRGENSSFRGGLWTVEKVAKETAKSLFKFK